MKTVEFRRALRSKKESRVLDYKQELDLDSKEHVTGIAKDIAAFANTIGGLIIIGVRDKTWEGIGVSSKAAAKVTPEDMDNKISNYLEPRVEFEVSAFTHRSKTFVAVEVPKSSNAPHMTKRDGTFQDSAGKSKSAFGKGALFVRHGAKSVPATRRDLERIISDHIAAERASLLKGVQQVVEAGPNAQVVAQPARGVRITDDPKAPAIRAVLDTERIGSITEELTAAVKLWKTEHSELASEILIHQFYARRSDLKLDGERAEFLMRSSLEHFLPGCYWATHLDARNLKNALTKIVESAGFPAEKESLKLVFLLGGTFAQDLLTKASGSERVSTAKSAEGLLRVVGLSFAERVQCLAPQEHRTRFSIRGAESFVSLREMLKNKDKARETATELARELVGTPSGLNKATFKNLDISIYAGDLRGRSR